MMIELTDEQIKEVLIFMRSESHTMYYEKCDAEELIEDFIESLTLPQIKQLAEQHNASVVQWLEFKQDDYKTYPPSENTIYLVKTDAEIHEGLFETDLDGIGYFDRLIDRVTHWAYLPQPK